MSVTEPRAKSRTEVAVVRQPVVDARRNPVGYELLFGHAGERLDPARDAKTTSALLIDAFGDIGLAELSGRHPAWVSISRDFLVEIGPPPFRPDRAVLQIAAHPARDDLLAVLQGLSRSGYTLALRQYEARADMESLLALSSMVKIEVAGRRSSELARTVELPAASGAVLVAEGVGDEATFALCQELGFTYFQGTLFAQPLVIRRDTVATGGLGAMRSLSAVNDPNLTFEDLERLITSDVGLSLKLLRYVNSAFFALPRTIGSVREAVGLLGLRTVRRWATVMAIAGASDASSELVALALHRARMCEVLAGAAAPGEREAMFTVGLFSVADALLGLPMAEVLETLPFSDEVRSALLNHEGPKGRLLAMVLAFERGEFPVMPEEVAGTASLGGSYRDALEWADQAGRAFA